MTSFNIEDLRANLPLSLALLNVGAASYFCFVDARVRNSDQSLRNRIHHWSNSSNLTKKVLTVSTLATVAAAIKKWQCTKESAWLTGAGVIFAALPFHHLFMVEEEEALNKDEEKKKIQLDLDKRENLCNQLASWTCKLNVKFLLGVAAAGIFFWANSKTGGQVSKAAAQITKSA